jgi:hypothetical protein
LATLPSFAANILGLLQSKSAAIFSSIKVLNTLVKVPGKSTEAEDVTEMSDEAQSGTEDEDD